MVLMKNRMENRMFFFCALQNDTVKLIETFRLKKNSVSPLLWKILNFNSEDIFRKRCLIETFCLNKKFCTPVTVKDLKLQFLYIKLHELGEKYKLEFSFIV